MAMYRIRILDDAVEDLRHLEKRVARLNDANPLVARLGYRLFAR
jgi:hypothetical protein